MKNRLFELFLSSLITIIAINSSAQSLVVNSTNYKQYIDMMGGDIERNSFAVQNADNTEEIIDWGFKDINFNFCRVQYDKKQELVEGEKNWAFYNKQVTTMQQIKAANPNIKFFATMRTDYDGFGDENNMPDWIVDYATKQIIDRDKYALFLVDYLEFMHDNDITVEYMSVTKEWTTFVNAYRARDIINKLVEECATRNIPVPHISDQGFWSISQGISYMNVVSSIGTKDLYHSFCSHDYQNEGDEKWKTIVALSNSMGKKMYNDEFSTGSGGPSYGEEPSITKAIGVYEEKAVAYEAGLSGEILFEIWSRGINKETRAIYFENNGEGRRLKGYYIMKLFANNTLNSTYVTTEINAMDNVWTMSFRKGDQITLWVINKGSTTYTDLPISVDASTIVGDIERTYWTDATPIDGSTLTYTANGNEFTPTIDGVSLNCFIFNVSDNASVCDDRTPEHIEGECYDGSYGIITENCDEGGLNLTDMYNANWTMYNDIDLTGKDSIQVRVATTKDIGFLDVRLDALDGTTVSTIAIPNTGSWQNFVTVKVPLNTLSDGEHNVYLVSNIDGTGRAFTLNWFGFLGEPESSCTNILPQIDAECFDAKSGRVESEGNNIGFIQNNDWIAFNNLNLSAMKSATINASSNNVGGTVELRIGSETGELIGSVNVSNTGGWKNYITSAANISTTIGTNNVYLVFTGAGGYLFNLDWVRFSETEIIITDIPNKAIQEIAVYPNPTSGIVNLSQLETFKVFNSFGQTILSGEGNQVDLSTQNQGVYTLQVGQQSFKIIKQ